MARSYILTVRIPFEQIDDLDARMEANKRLASMGVKEAKVKLQEVFDNKAPRGVHFEKVAESE